MPLLAQFLDAGQNSRVQRDSFQCLTVIAVIRTLRRAVIKTAAVRQVALPILLIVGVGIRTLIIAFAFKEFVQGTEDRGSNGSARDGGGIYRSHPLTDQHHANSVDDDVVAADE